MCQRNSHSTRSRTILLVEDHASYRSVVRDALGRYLADVVVLVAGSVAEALESLRSHDVDVLVADMTLPDGSAIDLLAGAGNIGGGDRRAVLFSNHSSIDMLPVLSRPDVHGYVSKEQGVKALASAIRETLGDVMDEADASPRFEQNG